MPGEVLGHIYLFKGLSAADLKQIQQISKLEKYTNGDVIFTEGEKAKAMFVIKYGTVAVRHSANGGDDVRVATLGTGAHFGEMPFITGDERNATAVAQENCEIVRIDYDKLKAIFELQPKTATHFFRAAAHFLANRLSETTEDLTFARETARKRA